MQKIKYCFSKTKQSKKSLQSVKGMHELTNKQLDIYENIIQNGENIMKSQNYNKIQLNIVEPVETFKRTLGLESEIVNKEMYSLTDLSNNNLVLRPEGTAPIIRYLLQNKLIYQPYKFYYYGPMFRYEKPQTGRQRQFYQFGVENIGLSSYLADIEVILAGNQFLKQNLQNQCQEEIPFKLVINTLGDQDTREQYNKSLISYYKKPEIYNQLSELSKLRIERNNPLRIFDSKDINDIELSFNAPKIDEFLSNNSKQQYQKIKKGLTQLGINFEEDFRLVRGLDYYNDICFEFKDISRESKSQSTLLAGGRYDQLANQLSQNDKLNIPAVGWAAGIDRIALKVQEKYIEIKNQGIRIGIVPIFNKNFKEEIQNKIEIQVLQIFDKINNKNINIQKLFYDQLSNQDVSIQNSQDNQQQQKQIVEMVLNQKKIQKQFEYLSSNNFDYAIIIGEDEIQQNSFTIKNLNTRESLTINANQI